MLEVVGRPLPRPPPPAVVGTRDEVADPRRAVPGGAHVVLRVGVIGEEGAGRVECQSVWVAKAGGEKGPLLRLRVEAEEEALLPPQLLGTVAKRRRHIVHVRRQVHRVAVDRVETALRPDGEAVPPVARPAAKAAETLRHVVATVAGGVAEAVEAFRPVGVDVERAVRTGEAAALLELSRHVLHRRHVSFLPEGDAEHTPVLSPDEGTPLAVEGEADPRALVRAGGAKPLDGEAVRGLKRRRRGSGLRPLGLLPLLIVVEGRDGDVLGAERPRTVRDGAEGRRLSPLLRVEAGLPPPFRRRGRGGPGRPGDDSLSAVPEAHPDRHGGRGPDGLGADRDDVRPATEGAPDVRADLRLVSPSSRDLAAVDPDPQVGEVREGRQRGRRRQRRQVEPLPEQADLAGLATLRDPQPLRARRRGERRLGGDEAARGDKGCEPGSASQSDAVPSVSHRGEIRYIPAHRYRILDTM